MSTIFVYVGLPGSGKSTHAQKWASTYKNCIYLSSDAVRAELYGDESIQGDNNKVFSIMLRRAKEAVSKGLDVVYGAI